MPLARTTITHIVGIGNHIPPCNGFLWHNMPWFSNTWWRIQMPYCDSASLEYTIYHNLLDIMVLYNALSFCLLNMEIMCWYWVCQPPYQPINFLGFCSSCVMLQPPFNCSMIKLNACQSILTCMGNSTHSHPPHIYITKHNTFWCYVHMSMQYVWCIGHMYVKSIDHVWDKNLWHVYCKMEDVSIEMELQEAKSHIFKY
jgi:hypothetical protein